MVQQEPPGPSPRGDAINKNTPTRKSAISADDGDSTERMKFNSHQASEDVKSVPENEEATS